MSINLMYSLSGYFELQILRKWAIEASVYKLSTKYLQRCLQLIAKHKTDENIPVS